MPKTYSMTRKLNLGRYGSQYEMLDIGIDGATSKAEAVAEINQWRSEIHQALIPAQKARLEEISNKPNLTAAEGAEREKLNKLMSELPF